MHELDANCKDYLWIFAHQNITGNSAGEKNITYLFSELRQTIYQDQAHYGPEQPDFPALITHYLTSSRVSERASLLMSTAERASEASEVSTVE